jgi:pimeloyl-ACP methyl ester carboxylesterase
VVFKRANHWLYLEQPEEFNALLLDFVHKGNAGRAKTSYVE